MMHGYGLVKRLCTELKDFMRMQDFSCIENFRGDSISVGFSSVLHQPHRKSMAPARSERRAIRKGLQSDKDWTSESFVKDTKSMVFELKNELYKKQKKQVFFLIFLHVRCQIRWCLNISWTMWLADDIRIPPSIKLIPVWKFNLLLLYGTT